MYTHVCTYTHVIYMHYTHVHAHIKQKYKPKPLTIATMLPQSHRWDACAVYGWLLQVVQAIANSPEGTPIATHTCTRTSYAHA